MKKKNFYKILLPIIVIILVVVLIFIFVSKRSQMKLIENPEIDTNVVNMIVKMDADLDRILDIDNGEQIGEVGSRNGEIVYGFKHIPQIELIKILRKSMIDEVIKKELYIRGFSGIQNNIVFLDNAETQSNFLLHKQKVETVSEIINTEALYGNEDLEQKLIDWEEQGYFNIRYYKTEVSSMDKVENKAEGKVLESLYVVGENYDGSVILDAIYYLNGEKVDIPPMPILNIKEMGYFEAYKFDEARPIDLGDVDSIIERVENYQGSQPYVEQNFEENNKKFE